VGILETIDSPQDLKAVPRTELPALAREIRDHIVEVVSQTGGHLAPSLGAVELAIAVHYVFDSPRDRIVWDVGHQAYAHKLLTGRRERFSTLRQHLGLSGFTKISESPHDAFSTGHSSTSVSAGLGIACAKELKNEKNKVVVIIGDGSMTAGLAYEGLNQAGALQKDLIVILNDNEMSISKNVGALSSFLSRTFSRKLLLEICKDLGDFLKSVPRLGDDIYQFDNLWEESLKTFITPGMLFQAFNFNYFGPINGHNLNHLIDILKNIKHLDEPVLLHVTTKKGMGYPPAESNPVYFHGVGCFEVETGNCIDHPSSLPTYTHVFGKALVDLAETDERIVAVTAAMPEGTGLSAFSRRFPERFFDVGIAEQHGVTFAAGMAVEGFRPVVAIYSTFLQRAYDQILHDVCIESLPVIFAVDRGGIVGEDGMTHHGLFDLTYLRSLPNMTVMAPKDENELCRMLATALAHDGPIALRYPRGAGLGVSIEAGYPPLPVGKAEILEEGGDVLVLAVGRCVQEARTAVRALAEEKIFGTLVNCRFVKPLDADLIGTLAERIRYVVTVEENVLHGGFGSAVLESLSDLGLSRCRITRVGIPDVFMEHGPQKTLRHKYRIDAPGILSAVKRLLSGT